MDGKLIAWARAVKMQQRHLPLSRRAGAVLWLFTDPARLADPLAVLRALPRALPRGLVGVVLRAPQGSAPGREIAAFCRQRGMVLAVAGEWRVAAALHAGLHLRGGWRPGTAPRALAALTGSAHGVAELRRVRRWGAMAFLSPAFATASHPGRPGLGPCRWGLLARRGGGGKVAAPVIAAPAIAAPVIAALGGMTAGRVRRLPQCRAAGAIGAWRERRG